MARLLDSRVGKIYRLENNPRSISDGAYTLLVESLSRANDIDFLAVKKMVVWRVPEDLGKERKWPFSGQEGKMVMLGGNQRYLALQELGYEKIPDEWIIEGKHPDGSWWTPAEAERFILLDNNPEGVSGETDYDMLVEAFNRECMHLVGIDFSQLPLDYAKEDEPAIEDEVESDEHGEKDEKLQGFIQRREDSRGMLNEILDMGFYAVVLFETHDQKMRFLNHLKAACRIEANRDVFINGFKLADALGVKIPYSGLKFPTPKPEKSLQELAMDGSKEGWEVRTGDEPEGEEVSDDKAEKEFDGQSMDLMVEV